MASPSTVAPTAARQIQSLHGQILLCGSPTPLKNRNCVFLLLLLSGGGKHIPNDKRHLKPLKEYLQWNHLWLSGHSPAFPNLSIAYSEWPLKKLNNRFIIMLREMLACSSREKLPTHRFRPTFTYTHTYVHAYTHIHKYIHTQTHPYTNIHAHWLGTGWTLWREARHGCFHQKFVSVQQ